MADGIGLAPIINDRRESIAVAPTAHAADHCYFDRCVLINRKGPMDVEDCIREGCRWHHGYGKDVWARFVGGIVPEIEPLSPRTA